MGEEENVAKSVQGGMGKGIEEFRCPPKHQKLSARSGPVIIPSEVYGRSTPKRGTEIISPVPQH